MKYLGDPEGLLDYWKRLVNRVQLHKCKKGSCLTETFKTIKKDGKKEKVKERHCRFNFPFLLNGFKLAFNDKTQELEGYEPDVKKDNDTLANPLKFGASYKKEHENDPNKLINTTLELLRNHPDMNNHIVELLLLWGANVDQKTVQTYDQLVRYILKYVLKPEEISDFFSKLKKAIAKKVDDDTPLNKTAQKVLMSCLGQRDMTSNECFLIAHGLPYVEFSQAPRIANLRGGSVAKTKVHKETDSIKDDDNWRNAYSNRENIDGYKRLCSG